MKIFQNVLSIASLLVVLIKCRGQLGDVCLETPCQNDGVCLINSRDPAEFLCSCPPFFNGTYCENYIGPLNCQDNPCLNGGTCFQNNSNRIRCQCPDHYVGALCQTLEVSRCESNPCENNGVCTPHENTFSCSCTPGFAGPTCSLLITTRCAIEPCQNGGTCFVSSYDVQEYYCMCTAGYTGEQCHKPVTECSCDNGGQCRQVTIPAEGIGLQCDCPPGYSGAHCEITPVNVCDEKPCVHGNCFLHGTNQSQYFCDCEDGFTGDNCDIPVQEGSCSSNPCLNSGSCSPVVTSSGTEYTLCECPPGYVGINCETSTEGCLPNPCLNGGICLASSPTSVTCQCDVGFVGSHCQYEGACHSNPCQNNGTCYNAYQPRDDDLLSYVCECQGIYRGANCNETSGPCASNPCQNGGVCVESVGGDAFGCICSLDFTGDICDTPKSELCSVNPTACNGSGEVCVDDGDDTFHCECFQGWRRNTEDTACHAPCTSNPCLNSGLCFLQEDQNFYCMCPEGFTGGLCERPVAPCTSCLNGGMCVMFSSAFYCECVDGYTGIDCSVPPPIDTVTTTLAPEQTCPSSICQNGGTCEVSAGFGIHCICPEGYTGLDCSQEVTSTTGTTPLTSTSTSSSTSTSTHTTRMEKATKEQTCPSSICQNGGTCEVSAGFGILCICPEGYTGLDCSQEVTSTTGTTPLTSTSTSILTNRTQAANKGVCSKINPCDDNAICVPNENQEGEILPMCLCPLGYAGATCSVRLPTPKVCEGNPCGPEAVCYSNAATFSGYSCLCLRTDGSCSGNYFAGSTPSPTDSSLCQPNPCQNGGTCKENGALFTCNCPPYIVGDFCETNIRNCVYKDSWFTEGDIRSEGCIKCNCTNGDWQCTDNDCYCEHENKLYENGQVWTDQCMTCFCFEGGWLCSDVDCSNTCEHNGNRYFSGDIREESCETCFCNNKVWSCTEKDCAISHVRFSRYKQLKLTHFPPKVNLKQADFCVDNDAVYFEGAVRRADCNLCTCSKKEWLCTIKNCDELPVIISIIFRLDYPFSLIEDRQDQLIRVITAYLEARHDVQEGQLLGIELSDGSIIVNITLQETQGTDQDVRFIADEIKKKVNSGSFSIAFDGFFIPAKNDSYSATIVGVDEEDSVLFLASVSACLASLVVIALLLIAVCLCRQHTRTVKRGSSSQKRKLWRSTGSESSEDFSPSATADAAWENSLERREEGDDVVLNILPSDRVRTCPGRLRQTGLEGI